MFDSPKRSYFGRNRHFFPSFFGVCRFAYVVNKAAERLVAMIHWDQTHETPMCISVPGGMAMKEKLQTSNGTGAPSLGPVYALRFQADFVCGNSGVCCGMDWPLPIEGPLLDRLRNAVETGKLTPPGDVPSSQLLVTDGRIPEGAAAVFGRNERGYCAFFDEQGGRLCSIHAQAGVSLLTDTCISFPRMPVHQPLGTFVTLSHYCPTVAALLFEAGGADVVADPAMMKGLSITGGLHAYRHPPPLARPGSFLDWEVYTLWEREAVALVGSTDYLPEEAMAGLFIAAEGIRQWPGTQVPAQHVRDAMEAVREMGHAPLRAALGRAGDPAPVYGMFGATLESNAGKVLKSPAQIWSSMAKGKGTPMTEAIGRYTRGSWEAFSPQLRRFLAAKLFANFFGYQSNGLRSCVFAVATQFATVRILAALLCVRDGAQLNRDRFTEAVRLADFMFLQRADRRGLVRGFGIAEQAPPETLLAPLAL